jgi:predicted alpha/beta superfamily hydrolase
VAVRWGIDQYFLVDTQKFGKLMIFSPSLWVKPDMKIKVDEEDTGGH